MVGRENMGTLYLKHENEEEINVTQEISGLRFLGLDTSPIITNSYQGNEGTDGAIPRISYYGKSTVTANFHLHFRDYADLLLAKRMIYQLFFRKGRYRIRTDIEPYIVYYVRSMPFEIKPYQNGFKDALFSIPFENPTGYSYSIQNSDELVDWQLGMNLPFDEEVKYRFTDKKIHLFNPSMIEIDPYFQRHELKLICYCEGSRVQVTNKTTSTEWCYNKPIKKTDKLLLDGIQTFCNGTFSSKDTNFGHLTLAPGWNDLVVSGATTSDITFSFPFIYLV